VSITDAGNRFYTATLEEAIDTLRHLGYKAVRRGGTGALYKANASAKLKAIAARLFNKEL
jgi:hypothetical protein